MHQFGSQYPIGKRDIEEFLSYAPFHRNIFIQRLVYIDIGAKADDCLNIVMDNNSNTGIDYG